jgi:steroid 5-alpha reductase family enzyme
MTFSTLIGLLILATAVWLVSLVRRDASLADPAWGFGFPAMAGLAWSGSPDPGSRGQLLLLLTSLWGCRLGIYLLWRNLGHGEDRRYRVMREHHGPAFWWRSWFTVFALQAVLLWWVGLPVQVAIQQGGDLFRHPNYFGDFCVWWALYGLAGPAGAWWTLLSPISMTLLLLFVSGVRLTESTIQSRRPEYAEYQRRTNAFFPGPPRRLSGSVH